MKTFKVLDGAILTSVQDLGRFGYQEYGVSPSGAMDTFSAKLANFLLGNEQNCAVLENTLKGLDLEFLCSSAFAITGGFCSAKLNSRPIKLYRTQKAKKGDILKLGFCKSGLRTYLAFLGGIDVPLVMNSRSTNLKAKFGGFEARALEKGDELSCFQKDLAQLKFLTLRREFFPKYKKNIEIFVILDAQSDNFADCDKDKFFSNEYEVSNDFDRMGIRLKGEEIHHKKGADIISDGISFGSIQIPGNNQPIIMMSDRQTTGGYTKIGTVSSVDLPKLAQAGSGIKISFKEISLEDSQNRLKTVFSFSKLCRETRRSKIKKYFLHINGRTFKTSIKRHS